MAGRDFEASSILPLYESLKQLSKIGIRSVGNEVSTHLAVHDIASLSYISKIGEIDFKISDNSTSVPASKLFEGLRSIPSLIGPEPAVTSRNIRLVSAIGYTSLERLTLRAAASQKTISRSALGEVQRTFRHTGSRAALALAYSDLPRKSAAKELGVIDRLVNPNPRLAAYYLRRER